MNILVIGAGGREHALVWKLAQNKAHTIYTKIQPALGGNVVLADGPLGANDEIVAFVNAEGIDLVVIGPEAPLAAGLADALQANGTKVFGPVRAGARLESSKEFSKDFMVKYNIPTAEYKAFTSAEEAKSYLKAAKMPIVVKADGLAAGKGVRVCMNLEDALQAVTDFMESAIFGAAGSKVVIEEFMTGPELSVMAFVDGNSYALLAPSRDHKRLLDRNAGPNTGGMGAFTPVAGITEEYMNTVKTKVFDNVLRGLKEEGINYCGIIYAGLMLTPNGPKTLEFNCRFGDPETQVLLPMLKNDLSEVIMACVNGKLSDVKVEQNPGAAVTVILASQGYPDKPVTGLEITGLEDAKNLVFHSGTKLDGCKYYTSGGRVLAVTAVGVDFENARAKAYADAAKIHFQGMQFRTDIGVSYDN